MARRSMPVASRLPVVRTILDRLDSRYIRRRAVEELAQRVQLLEVQLEWRGDIGDRVDTVAQFLTPASSLNRLERLGNNDDGGYFLAVDEISGTFAVSVGVGPDSSADDDLARRGLRVHQFDPTVSHTSAREPSVVFHEIGVTGRASAPNMITLAEMLMMSCQDPLEEATLLMDAEGAEWDALAATDDETLRRFRQMSIEFHGLQMLANDELWPVMYEALSRLDNSFQCVTRHANNFAGSVIVADRLVPAVVEATFIRRDLFRPAGENDEPFDSRSTPNDVTWPDLPQDRLFEYSSTRLPSCAPSAAPLADLVLRQSRTDRG